MQTRAVPDIRAMRSLLSVPANRPEFATKAAASNANALFLDLEDSVFSDQKIAARQAAIGLIESVDWGGKRLLVRVNGLDTEWGFRDLLQVADACPRLDGFMVPKVETPDQIDFLEKLLDQLDAERKQAPLELHILVETAAGVARVEALLEKARRLLSVTFGAGDYAISLGLYGRARMAGNSDYAVLAQENDNARSLHWGDNHHFAMARVANACHAFGIIPVDGPYGNFRDSEAEAVATRRARALGFQAKWAIHPTQIDAINRAFRPSDEDLEWARTVASALEEARQRGAGAAQLDGRLIEAATMKTVDRILAQARLSDGR